MLTGPLPADVVPPLKNARKDLPRSYGDGCHLDFTTTEPPPCVYGNPESATTVVVFGDSHAAQWLPAVEQLAAQRDWRVVSLTKSGCPPVSVTVWNQPLKRNYRECGAWREQVLARIAEEHPALVLVSAARDYQIIDDAGRHPFDEALDAWRAGMVDVLTQVTQRAERVVLLADTPRLADDPLECLANHGAIENCPSPRDAMVDPAYADLETTAAADSGVGYLSATDWLCPGTTCPLVMGTNLVYRDSQHLTASFMTVLADRLGVVLDQLA